MTPSYLLTKFLSLLPNRNRSVSFAAKEMDTFAAFIISFLLNWVVRSVPQVYIQIFVVLPVKS